MLTLKRGIFTARQHSIASYASSVLAIAGTSVCLFICLLCAVAGIVKSAQARIMGFSWQMPLGLLHIGPCCLPVTLALGVCLTAGIHPTGKES